MYATTKGVIVFLTAIFSGNSSPTYPNLIVTKGQKISVEIPAAAEGINWPKAKWMQGYLVAPDQNGEVRFEVRNPNTNTIMKSVQLTHFKPADWNLDSWVNGLDFDGFIEAFEQGSYSADFNGDGFVNGMDFDEFVESFENPGP